MVLITKAITEKIMMAFGQLDSMGRLMHPLIESLFDCVHPEHNNVKDDLLQGEVRGKHDDFKKFEETLMNIKKKPDLLAGLMDVKDVVGRTIFTKAVEDHCYEITKILINHNIMEHELYFVDLPEELEELLVSHGLLTEIEEEHDRHQEG